MLARLKSEMVFFNGVRRALARTKPIIATQTKTFCDYAEEWAAQFGDRVALLSGHERSLIGFGTSAPIAMPAGRAQMASSKAMSSACSCPTGRSICRSGSGSRAPG